jgi:hypothetical protein
MDKRPSTAELADLLGPEPVKAPVERRHPFKEYTYEELTNAPKKVYLCGDDDRPVLLTDSLWQTMGLLKSGKTFFCLELGFCIASVSNSMGYQPKRVTSLTLSLRAASVAISNASWRFVRSMNTNSERSSVFPKVTTSRRL